MEETEARPTARCEDREGGDQRSRTQETGGMLGLGVFFLSSPFLPLLPPRSRGSLRQREF